MYFKKEEDKIFKQGERKGEKWKKSENGVEISSKNSTRSLLKRGFTGYNTLTN